MNFDTKREIMSSGLEKNLVFLHGFANIICIITRKFDFRGKIKGKFEKIIKEKGKFLIDMPVCFRLRFSFVVF